MEWYQEAPVKKYEAQGFGSAAAGTTPCWRRWCGGSCSGGDDEPAAVKLEGEVVMLSHEGHIVSVVGGDAFIWSWGGADFSALRSPTSFWSLLFSSASFWHHLFRYSHSTSVCFSLVLWSKFYVAQYTWKIKIKRNKKTCFRCWPNFKMSWAFYSANVDFAYHQCLYSQNVAQFVLILWVMVAGLRGLNWISEMCRCYFEWSRNIPYWT